MKNEYGHEQIITFADIYSVSKSCIILCRKLLKIGGETVCLHHKEEELIDFFNKKGSLCEADIEIIEMEENNCHENSALLLMSAPDQYQLYTGFCLDRGIWMRHSWLSDEHGRTIETTDIRDKYFGVELKKNMWQKLFFVCQYLGIKYTQAMNPQTISMLLDTKALSQALIHFNNTKLLKQKIQQAINVKVENEK